jgi:hypothetical protein
MTPIQETMLRQRLANGTPDERLLNDKLVAIGGDILVLMPPDMKPNPEFQQQWVRWQLEHGQLIDAPITLRRKEVSGCHRNVATIWRKKQYGIAAICSGYGLLDDGLWADHSWGILPDGGILETTFRREKYFGLMHEAGMADIFADIELGKLAGRKGAAWKPSRKIEDGLAKLMEELLTENPGDGWKKSEDEARRTRWPVRGSNPRFAPE